MILILSGILLLGLLIAMVVLVLINKTNGRIISSGEKRAYLLYVPKSYGPQQPTPLVISIHGYAEWPAHQAQISRWNKLADKEGFIIVNIPAPGDAGAVLDHFSAAATKHYLDHFAAAPSPNPPA